MSGKESAQNCAVGWLAATERGPTVVVGAVLGVVGKVAVALTGALAGASALGYTVAGG